MISRALDSNNDLFLKNGRVAINTDGDQVAQHVRTRLLTYLGEWFLDVNAGVPYFQRILTKPVNLVLTESVLKATISQTPGVEKLISFEFDFNRNTRVLNIQFEALTEFGEISSTISLNQSFVGV